MKRRIEIMMTPKTKILIVEHDASDLELMQYELKKGGLHFVSEIVHTEEDYGNALKTFLPDIILSDYSFPSFDGNTAFIMREAIAPDTPFIFVSGSIGEENSIEYIKNGVTDYALKDKLFTLTTKINRALREAKEKQQRLKTERERIQNEGRLARAEEIAHMGNWELNYLTNVILLSDEGCRIFEFLPGENERTVETWSCLIHPDDLDFVMQTTTEARNSLEDTSYYYRIILKEGNIRYIYSESKFEFDAKGVAIGIYGIVQDVTERKLAEKERTKMVNDLMHRNKDLEQFAYIVSHNLRGPVANILGATNGLNYPGLNTEKKDILRLGLNDSVTRLDDVIKDLNNILQVKRIIDEIKEKVCFSKLVDDIKISIKNAIDDNKIKITYNFSEIDEFLSLKSYLHSIFYNLISNSIKYRQREIPCVIDIKSLVDKDTITLIFADNGMGIDLQKRGEQVFGLYRRFHNNMEGKGMGLFMVKTQVETLGGKISIQSEVNKGTEFKIQFEV